MITAQTAVYGVIGHPIDHSLSPQIHDYFARGTDQDICYPVFHVLPERLGEAIKGAHRLGIQGLNVTIPHKQACVPYVCRLDKTAEAIGAVNTLVYEAEGYAGYNTDYLGAYMSLKVMGIDIAGKPVVVIGAGGTAHAACVMAAEKGASEITIANRTPENAESLAGRVRSLYSLPVTAIPLSGLKDVTRKDVVIEATSAGFKDQAEICPVGSANFFEGVTAALEVIYMPWETKFLKMAKSKGVPAVNGFPALVFQAAASFEIWRGLTLTEPFLKKAVADLEALVRPA